VNPAPPDLLDPLASGKYAARELCVHLGIPDTDIGLYGEGLGLVVYVRAERKKIRLRPGDWDNLVLSYFPADIRAFLIVLPPGINAESAQNIAATVWRMVRSTGYYNPTRPEYMATEHYRAAFALGGAQAVADLILGEQAQGVPAQPVLPA
jgi:hypothetical protein